MKVTRILLFLIPLATLLCRAAVAESSVQISCWPAFTSTHLDVHHLDGGLNFTYLSRNVEGTYETNVEGALVLEDSKLTLDAKYEQGWGLPFVVYAVLVFENGQLIFKEDFTNNCKSPGINMFPGDQVELVRVKYPAKTAENIKVIVWAR